MNSRLLTLMLTLAGATALGTSFVGTARADDTEIFFGANSNPAASRPNILFVIDTSGSMGSLVTTQMPYDPNTNYSGSCRPDRVYWTTGTNASAPPGCGTSQYVDLGKFYCVAAKPSLDATGVYTAAPAAQWNGSSSPKQWTTLSTRRTGNETDCAADNATRSGQANADGKYPGNGSNGPYTSNAAQAIVWGQGNATQTYTFFSGNFMNYWYGARTVSRTRLQIVQDVLNQTLDGLANVNVGLMRYDTGAEGGMVIQPVSDISTSLAAMQAQVNSLSPSGNTPLSETLYEAALYFRGSAVDFGNRSSPVLSVAGSRKSANTTQYQSPITSDCAKNFIVYLTDGLPNADYSAEAKILALPDFRTKIGSSCGPNVPVDGTQSGTNLTSGRCFDDLAEYLYQTDQATGTNGTPSVSGVQNVTLYTIGFGPDVAGTQLLIDAARRGGGQAYDADDTASLTTVLQSIVRNILTQNTFFTSPAISVNAFNRTRNLNDLFITMFQSVGDYHWPGNLKKYRLRENGTIVGSNGLPAVDPSTGFFRIDANSFWQDPSGPNDGANVAAGGAANRLPDPAVRNVYTDLTLGDLTVPANLVADANSGILPETLGAAVGDTAARSVLIQFARGADVDDANGDGSRTDERFQMGDPLHAQPVSVIYGGTSAVPNVDDALVFTATNDGYLHAVSPTTGEEAWSFVPSELLPRMNQLYQNPTVTSKSYGLDGSLRVFRYDRNNNGIIEPADGDRVLLMFGMGRGGSTYYTLDVTVKDKPQLLYRLTPAQLPGLGQTWSTPTFARVNITGATQNSLKLVAIFGGGYDVTQDNVPYNTDDTGNRVFMVDAVSGAMLWHAGPAAGFGYDATANLQLLKMNNSIPADIRVIDLDGDGFADRMYAADTGARIWRFDIINGSPAASLVTGGVFASLGVADGVGTSPADARRFYYAPDVALMKANGRIFLNISIGTGFRGSPLNVQIQDRFYALRDFNAFNALSQVQYAALTPITDTSAGLVDITGVDAPVLAATSLGWKMRMISGSTWVGEKVLAEARTFGGQVFFTSYTPNGAAVATCSVSAGTNRLYVVDAATGGVVTDRSSKATDLPSAGIASNVVFVFPSPDNPANKDSNEQWCKGVDCPKPPPPRCLIGLLDCGRLGEMAPVRTFWTQQSVDD
jgi:type IV pilus assembly protein PilY1